MQDYYKSTVGWVRSLSGVFVFSDGLFSCERDGECESWGICFGWRVMMQVDHELTVG